MLDIRAVILNLAHRIAIAGLATLALLTFGAVTAMAGPQAARIDASAYPEVEIVFHPADLGSETEVSMERLIVIEDGTQLPDSAVLALRAVTLGEGEEALGVRIRSQLAKGAGTVHTLTIGTTDSPGVILAEFQEGAAAAPASTAQGESETSQAGLDRYAMVVAAGLLVAGGVVFARSRLRARRRCERCGELIEPFLEGCVTCTNPEHMAAARSGKSADQLFAETFRRIARPTPEAVLAADPASATAAVGAAPSGPSVETSLSPTMLQRTEIVERVPVLEWESGGRRGRLPLVGHPKFVVGTDTNGTVVFSDRGDILPHARIDAVGDHYVVHDLGVSGTIVNGKPVRRKVLEYGDQLVLAGRKFRFILDRAREDD
ncbi:MAG: FHA domain-containing protein [Candidatus Schekmanbacteria bacterium]|nr:FHA domain-containing protein [Candidatus Schekmanbacteria bacterium]